jgi:hypothetical protein
VQRAFQLLREARFDAPLPCASAVARVHARTGLNLSRAVARAGFGRGHLLEIVVYVPGGNGGPDETEAAEELVRLLVGEELFERWVGTVSATPTVRGGPLNVINRNAEERAALPVATLLETARAALAGLRLGLPPVLESASSDSEDWVMFELKPEPALDFAAQDDLLLCSTRMPELKKCFLRGERFFSGRFCNSDVLFTYLKYESRERAPEARLTERARLENIVTQVLRHEQAALIGLGLGLRYGYLDLAVRDPDCIRNQLWQALRAAEMSERTWLLFCDSELEREYLALHAEAPAPFWGT